MRPDGYHSVRTVMQTVSLADVVHLRHAADPGIRLTCDVPWVPIDARNLVWRAARAFLDHIGSPDAGIHVRLTKRIPVQAGLGGGSSDAAAILMGLNELLGSPLCDDELHALATRLGSDVPFFLFGGTALMEGRGEWGQPLPDGPELHMVIVKPNSGVATADAYRALDAMPARPDTDRAATVVEAIRHHDAQRLLAAMSNDFEIVIDSLCRESAEAMRTMRKLGAATCHLCGSGSAVFGVVASEEAAEEIAESMRRRWRNVYVCRTVGRAEAQGR